MPTVLLLDVSLSMSRPVQTADQTENHTRYTLACASVNTFLDYLSIHAKLEYVALVAFSSIFEVVVPFTRDYDAIRVKLPHIDDGDKTCIEQALQGVNQLVLNEWGSQNPVQIIMITDGSVGVGAIGRNKIIQNLPLPPSYPARIHVLPVASPHDSSLPHAMPLYQKMIEQASSSTNNASLGILPRGSVYCPDQLSLSGVSTAMSRLCEQQYADFACTLHCGQLSSRVLLYPPPQTVIDEAGTRMNLATQIHVVGFISQQDLGTPITITKHLLIPQSQMNDRRDNFGAKTSSKFVISSRVPSGRLSLPLIADGSCEAIPNEDGMSNENSVSDDDMMDPSKVPNFCVLLHGALKVEGMSAVVQLGENWWGVIAAWCEASRSRRSCLLLSALIPGPQAAPWLGDLSELGPMSDGGGASEAFPVRACRSYSGGGGASWSRPHALLTDVQKVLRHARKLPEKTQHLYKELNRLRRSAISVGFSELLTCVGAALERECASLPPNSPPECALQLAHAAAALREPRTALDIKHSLQPLPANFSVSMSH